ncbi:sensor histidine kinase [Actinomarinicola tropica]|uniref:histidine kinase n=1 Tax=Actinomarinicola tropica TaxID=2789776 RepID=A0A5Q2RI42_9ACTN|nr:ATP-binding protein [Actinomarinicola tropica]QGG93667.1 histidine kinase [Actinomarinicola tropica]
MSRPERQPSLKERVRRLLTVTLVIIGAIIVLTVVSLVRLIDARSRVYDEVDPAMVESAELLSAHIDQENGVRGFVISDGDDLFLEPFRSGREDAERLRADLDRRLASFGVLADELERIDEATTRWSEEYAAPAIAAARAGEASVGDAESLEEGRRLFEEVRASFDSLDDALREERTEAIEDVNTATSFLIAAIAGLAAMSITSKIVLWRTYHRAVAAPLDALGADAMAIAEGDLGRHIDPPDHLELARLATAMEEMRIRLVNDLRSIETTYAALEERTAELERSNSDLEQFAYVASHDLQEPLRKVISFTQLLQSRYGDQLDERADQYITYAVDGARRMQNLINDLLAFSRVGRLTREHERVDLGEVLGEAVDNLSEAIEASGATIDVGEMPSVLGDPILLVSLFQNLLGNSVKFRRDDEPPEVTVRSRRAPADDGWIVELTDNGIGIEPEFGERVFVIFQRLHGKEAYAGTGIGLAMCRKIVEHHGGTIHIEQPDGPGTRFVIELPDRTPEPALEPTTGSDPT